MKRLIQPRLVTLILLLSLFVNPLFSQVDSGDVELIKDPRLDLLVKKQVQINKVAVYKNSRGDYKGYRIMVLSTNNRDLANKTKSDLLRYFPDQNVYMGYQSPYYKIRMGDFLKRQEADAFKKELSRVYDQPTYVVQDIIKVTPEQEAKLFEENAE